MTLSNMYKGNVLKLYQKASNPTKKSESDYCNDITRKLVNLVDARFGNKTSQKTPKEKNTYHNLRDSLDEAYLVAKKIVKYPGNHQGLKEHFGPLSESVLNEVQLSSNNVVNIAYVAETMAKLYRQKHGAKIAHNVFHDEIIHDKHISPETRDFYNKFFKKYHSDMI